MTPVLCPTKILLMHRAWIGGVPAKRIAAQYRIPLEVVERLMQNPRREIEKLRRAACGKRAPVAKEAPIRWERPKLRPEWPHGHLMSEKRIARLYGERRYGRAA